MQFEVNQIESDYKKKGRSKRTAFL